MWTTRVVTIHAGDRTYEYTPDTAFVNAVRDVATEMGWTLFIVHVGGQEIEPHEAPATVGDAQGDIVVSPYQTAGGVWRSHIRNILLNEYVPTRIVLSAHVQERIALWTWALPFEWMAALYGDREGDVITLTDIKWLARGSIGSVSASLPHDATGIIHSHHRLGCYFSSTDVSDVSTFINIVVAQSRHDDAVELEAMVAVGSFTVPAIDIALRVYALGDVEPNRIPVPERARRIAERIAARFAPRSLFFDLDRHPFPLTAYGRHF